MIKARNGVFTERLTSVLRELHPGEANRRPALFILEVAAALLSVLALHDRISGNTAVSTEALLAAGLWGSLFAAALLRTIRVRLPILARQKY